VIAMTNASQNTGKVTKLNPEELRLQRMCHYLSRWMPQVEIGIVFLLRIPH